MFSIDDPNMTKQRTHTPKVGGERGLGSVVILQVSYSRHQLPGPSLPEPSLGLCAHLSQVRSLGKLQRLWVVALQMGKLAWNRLVLNY